MEPLDILDRLFGPAGGMGKEDLDMLYEAVAPGTDAAEIIHRLAVEAAAQYRAANRKVPEHLQAALDWTVSRRKRNS